MKHEDAEFKRRAFVGSWKSKRKDLLLRIISKHIEGIRLYALVSYIKAVPYHERCGRGFDHYDDYQDVSGDLSYFKREGLVVNDNGYWRMKR